MFSSRKTAAPAAAASGYTIAKSLRFRQSASAYLSRSPSVTGNRQKYTFSAWIKRGALSNGTRQEIIAAGQDSNNNTLLAWNTDDTIRFFNQTAGTVSMNKITTAVYRDPSAWYHIVFAVDTTQSTSSNRNRLYVNGSEVTSFSTNTDATLNENQFFDYSTSTYNALGRYAPSSLEYFDGYMAEVNFVDGQQLTPSSFGSYNSTTGVWQPIAYTGTYGTNGFYLKFTNTSSTATLGNDSSGNSNTWTTNNFSLTAGSTYDSMTDVPTLTSATVANYAVMNPLSYYGTSSPTYSDGNLKVQTLTSTTTFAFGSMAFPSTGKWYFEFSPTASSNTEYAYYCGIANYTISGSCIYYNNSGGSNGQVYVNGSANGQTGAGYGIGDWIGVAVDSDGGTVKFYKNGSLQVTVTYSVTSSYFYAAMADGSSSSNCTYAINFGQQPWNYTPPSGYVALNTYNLPTSTITNGSKYMDASLYTGTGSNGLVVTNGGFYPDLIWAKARSAAYYNTLLDYQRGVAVRLFSNLTDAESNNGCQSSFNSNGFTLNADAGGVNNSGSTYVAWQWNAGSGTSSSNTNGSITSNVDVNTTAGFSIVKYTGNGTAGATVGHGLGVAPSLVICKDRQAATSWPVYHSSLGGTQWILLNSTNAATTSAQEWNNTNPTSSVFSVGSSSSNSNQSANTYVAYCWSEIAGYSKFGGYTGNSSSDGVFIYLGFRPKFIFIKNYQSATDWYFEDSARDTYNVASSVLSPNTSSAESSGTYLIDFLSNGFKLRTANGNINSSGNSYIYGCWAENPFKNALAR